MADFELVNQLIEGGILSEINTDETAKEIEQKFPEGAILLACGDRDRFSFYFDDCSQKSKLHILSLNGGALLLAAQGQEQARDVLIENIKGAIQLKSVQLSLLQIHYPCGMAQLLGIDLSATILTLIRAKKFLQDTLPNHKTLPLISIDWRSSDKVEEHARGVKTYLIKLKLSNEPESL